MFALGVLFMISACSAPMDLYQEENSLGCHLSGLVEHISHETGYLTADLPGISGSVRCHCDVCSKSLRSLSAIVSAC